MGGKTPESAYLDGVIKNRRAGKKDSFKDKEEKLKGANKALDEALKMHIMASKNVPYSFEFYVKLNPDFLLSLAQEFLFHSDFSLAQIKEKIQNPTNPTHLVGKAAKLLDTVVKRVYGLIPGYMLASRAKLINGNINGAKISLEKALQFDPKNEEAHILNAIIVYSNGNLEAATNSIKEALANNFEIINNPFFMCIKGQIELEKGDYEEGLKTMIKTYQLPGVQDFDDYKRGVKNKYMTVIEFSENVRSQIFIMTAKAYALNKNYTESKKIMGDAIMEFSGTEEEATIFLGNADLHILQNDLKKALSILKAVEPTNKGYMAARKKLAEIYLNNLCQRRQYAKCFYDLCVAFPTFENYMAYGDALMTIQEPEEAKLANEEANN
jgi:tetratricopeptide repeat protein 21B